MQFQLQAVSEIPRAGGPGSRPSPYMPLLGSLREHPNQWFLVTAADKGDREALRTVRSAGAFLRNYRKSGFEHRERTVEGQLRLYARYSPVALTAAS